jgi:hypothetical protein
MEVLDEFDVGTNMRTPLGMNEFMMCCVEKNEGVFSCIVVGLAQNVAYKLPTYFTGHISNTTSPKRER